MQAGRARTRAGGAEAVLHELRARSRGGAGSHVFLRHQLNIALRRAPHRLRLRGRDAAARLPGSCRDLRRTTSAACPVVRIAPSQRPEEKCIDPDAWQRAAVRREGILRRDPHECLVSQSTQHGHQDSARISRVACVRRTKIDPAPCSHLPQNPAQVSA